MVIQLSKDRSARLLKHVVRCYFRLSDNPRAREALRQCLPDQLKDQTFAVCLLDDPSTKRWLSQLLKNLEQPVMPPQWHPVSDTPSVTSYGQSCPFSSQYSPDTNSLAVCGILRYSLPVLRQYYASYFHWQNVTDIDTSVWLYMWMYVKYWCELTTDRKTLYTLLIWDVSDCCMGTKSLCLFGRHLISVKLCQRELISSSRTELTKVNWKLFSDVNTIFYEN